MISDIREVETINSFFGSPGSHKWIESWIYIGSHLNCPIYPLEDKFGFKLRFEQEEYTMLMCLWWSTSLGEALMSPLNYPCGWEPSQPTHNDATMKIDGKCLIELIRSCRNKVQISRSVRMPQLHTSRHFHVTPIVIINDSSSHDLILDSQYFCHSIPAVAENPSLSWLYYQAFTVGTISVTPKVRPSRSSHTRERSSQCSNAHSGYGPNCLTTFWTQLTYRFNGRTAQPLEHTTALGGEEW